MTTRKEFKFFTITDFDKQAAYLIAMHRQGWQLTKIVAGVVFHFEQVKPADVVYQLDFQEKDTDKESYLQLYKDYGWECVVSNTQMMIFRKPAQADDDLTIFSDKESKIEMLKKLFSYRAIFLFMAYLPLSNVLKHHSPMGNLATAISLLVLNFMMLLVFSHLAYSFYRLRKLVKGN